MYDVVKETFEDKVFRVSADERATSPLYIKLLAGAATGGIGSALVNPMDLVKVRMQADRTGARYNNNFTFACRQIYQQEGLVEGFYRGVAATTFRAMALTAAQLPSYDHMKHTLLTKTSLEEGVTVHMISSMFAGLMAATASSPMDVMKTQIQNEAKSGGSNVLGRAFMQVLRTDGVRGFFKGWLPNWFRLGPHTIISLMVYEELRSTMGIKPM
ncbi:Mitochondrial Carrier (MC) protein [Phytophthora megakarya]|uniref:Mitochondrial Carrier (MC) protein n=1 Tax=Phytophthora megakarya TaxID=4795 RepID=A0A225UX03_9STRA|nr:Mitochondrial Carrier (MC) protein [Phytophthora megakarya]